MKNIKGYKPIFPGAYFKAFTLMELIVSLLISGLVIAAAAGLILNFSTWESKQNNDMDKYNKLLQFHKSIARDMRESVGIKHYDDETIFRVAADIDISYKLDDGFVIRSVNETADTFLIDIKNWYLIKDKVSGLPLILEIYAGNEHQEIDTFHIIKVYDNEMLFNTSEIETLSLN